MGKRHWPDGVKVAREGESPWDPEPANPEYVGMPAAEQLVSAQAQLDWNTRDLDGATWAIHPVDLRELRSLVDGNALLGLYFTIAADPELEGAGPRLVWADEWPNHW